MSVGDFRAEVEKAGFEVVERVPAAMINRWLSRRAFAHPHMQAIVAKKPDAA